MPSFHIKYRNGTIKRVEADTIGAATEGQFILKSKEEI